MLILVLKILIYKKVKIKNLEIKARFKFVVFLNHSVLYMTSSHTSGIFQSLYRTSL